MKTTGIIYRATNKTNNKMYIGQTIKTLNLRKSEHFSGCQRTNNKFARALKKYKYKDWKWEILVENVPVDQLDLLERSYIWGLSTFEFGYNSTLGGNSIRGFHHSEQSKNKISQSHIGKLHSEKSKKKMSKSRRGKGNHRFGIHPSDQTLKKMSQSHWSNGPKAKEIGEEISVINSKTYEITKPNGEIEIIKNLKKYCIDFKLNPGSMYDVVNGKAHSHKKYKAKRIN